MRIRARLALAINWLDWQFARQIELFERRFLNKSELTMTSDLRQRLYNKWADEVEAFKKQVQKKQVQNDPVVERIRGWLNESVEGGARWVIIVRDDFDGVTYPLPITRAAEVQTAIDAVSDLEEALEVYDLALPIEPQLAESRAWHPPNGVGAR